MAIMWKSPKFLGMEIIDNMDKNKNFEVCARAIIQNNGKILVC